MADLRGDKGDGCIRPPAKPSKIVRCKIPPIGTVFNVNGFGRMSQCVTANSYFTAEL